MIRKCTEQDAGTMQAIINEAARAYEGHIPADCYHQPYMTRDDLLGEIAAGVTFYGYEDAGRLVAVMGIQDRGPVMLIRHAYTHPAAQRQGIGRRLLLHLVCMACKPVLIGTWRDATWAIRFYQKHSFRLVSEAEKERLLRCYWTIPERQIETSVVLANDRYQPDQPAP